MAAIAKPYLRLLLNWRMRILHLILPMALSICSGSLAAQIRVERLSLVAPSVAELYANVPNKLRIQGLMPTDSVTFRHSKVRRIVGSEFMVNAATDALADTLLVHRAGKSIYSEAYRVVKDIHLVLYLGAMKMTGVKYATVKDLTNSDSLLITTGNYRSEIAVKSFDFALITNGAYDNYGKIEGCVIRSQQNARLSSLKHGDRIYIDNVRVHLPWDKTDRLLVGSALEIIK